MNLRENSNDLTVLLTLKGRPQHTLRWLWHANRTHLPFHVIVADGEVHPTIERLLSDPATFANLSFEYHRYDDRTLSDFFRKCVDAVRKVKTRYVMMSDNDDFLFPFGLQRSMAFLDSAPEYACAGGNIPGFSILHRPEMDAGVIGPLDRISYRCAMDGYPCRDLAEESVSARALGELSHYQAVYYHVYRVSVLRTIMEEIAALDFTDLVIHEFFWALRAVTLGKGRSDPSLLCYFRQRGTSTPRVEWAYHLLGSCLPRDFRKMAAAIAREAARIDGCDSATIEEEIREIYAARLRWTLANTMLRHRFPRLFAIKRFFLAHHLPSVVPGWLRRRLDTRSLLRKLAKNGANGQTISAHSAELSDIDSTLGGDAFIAFARQHAPDFLAASGE